MQAVIITKIHESPCGMLLIGSFDNKLCLCDWLHAKHHDQVLGRLRRLLGAELKEGTSAVIESAEKQLDEYFAGKRQRFEIPLLLAGTAFQKRVWRQLLEIPYGQTMSYGELARLIGMPRAVRAVANANAANSISIPVPCHRVVGEDGSLTGYAGGLQAKAFLLGLEQNSVRAGSGCDWSAEGTQ